MTKDENRQRLTALWKEAVTLADSQRILTEAFREWNRRALAALVEICGSDCEIVRDFKRLRYEPPDAVLTAAEHIIGDSDVPLVGMNIPLVAAQQQAYRQGLEEAAELLLVARTRL